MDSALTEPVNSRMLQFETTVVDIHISFYDLYVELSDENKKIVDNLDDRRLRVLRQLIRGDIILKDSLLASAMQSSRINELIGNLLGSRE